MLYIDLICPYPLTKQKLIFFIKRKLHQLVKLDFKRTSFTSSIL